MSGMGRREFVALLGGAAAAWPLSARAQQPAMPVIGYFSGRSPAAEAPLHVPFLKALAESSFTVGRNVAIEYRFAHYNYERLSALAGELIRLGPQVIVAIPTAATRTVRNATSTIPIVMSGVADPIGEGLIVSFARPGGNVTGVTASLSWAAYAKQLQLLKDAVPTARRVALLRDPSNQAGTTRRWTAS